MIRMQLTPNDLADMRFAYSPLLELVVSFRMLFKPTMQKSLHGRWVEQSLPALHGVEFPCMTALLTAGQYIPDFITPTPTDARPSLERELEFLAATPHSLIRQNMLELIQVGGDSAMRQMFLVHPAEALTGLIEEMREYWRRVLAQHWSRMSTVLENDLLYRARHLALDGSGAVMSVIDHQVEYEGDASTLLIHKDTCRLDIHREEPASRGDGLQFVPVIFGASHLYHRRAPAWRLMVMYGARGSGLWHSVLPDPDEALEILLGAGKARMMTALTQPASNAELARRLSLTAGAVSQHIKNLHQAGMVESFRSGKHVYYRLSARGEKLMALF